METFFLVLRSDLNVASKHKTRLAAEAHAEELCSKTQQKYFIAEVLAVVFIDHLPTKWQQFGSAPVETHVALEEA
jgi:hypothetical protein